MIANISLTKESYFEQKERKGTIQIFHPVLFEFFIIDTKEKK